MNHQEAIDTIRSEPFKFQIDEFTNELTAKKGTIQDIENPDKQLAYLKHVVSLDPDAVMRYLAGEPEHFAQFTTITTPTGTARHLLEVADKIFYEYSNAGKFLREAALRAFQNRGVEPGEEMNVIEDLLKKQAEAEEVNHGEEELQNKID